MEHFWQTIQGWMDFTDLYAQQVARVPKVGAHFVEVGSFMGASAAFMAVEIANSGKSIQFDTCDTFSGIERANVPNDAEWAAYQRAMSQVGTLEAACRANLAPVADLVRLRVGDSLDLASTYADGSLDFVFLDDDHNTLHVLRELDAWWPKLKAGGTLAGHDIDWADVRNAVST